MVNSFAGEWMNVSKTTFYLLKKVRVKLIHSLFSPLFSEFIILKEDRLLLELTNW